MGTKNRSSADSEKDFVGFTITSVEILNVGAIDYLEIKLQDRLPHLDCLYATNGVGKTTLLEALSLLGHLPCMPLMCLDREYPSLLRLVTGTQAEPIHAYLKDTIAGVPSKDRDLRAIMEQLRASHDKCVGAIRMSVVDPEAADAPYGGSLTHSFIILVTSGQKGHTPTLTGLLSRETHEGKAESDYSLERHFALFVNKTATDLGSMRELAARLARGRTFTDDGETHRPFADFLKRPESQIRATGEKRKVCYVNTDLNDFGRGNDLRESPKNIEKSFLPEVIDRFGIGFSNGQSGLYPRLEAINFNLREILNAPLNRFSDAYAVSQTVQVSIFSRKGTKLDFKAHRGWGVAFDIQFLSAGENEVFFLLLMAYTMRAEPGVASIMLLDEPDLHVAAPMRRPLFNTLLDILVGDCGQTKREYEYPPDRPSQVVICSHSPVMLDVCRERGLSLRKHVRLLYRRFEDDTADKSRLVALHDARYLSRLHTDNPVSILQPRVWFARRAERLHKAWYWWKGYWAPMNPRENGLSPAASFFATATIFLLFCIVVSFTVAFINDTANVDKPKPFGLGPITLFWIKPGNWVSEMLGSGPLKIHDAIREWAVGFALGGGVLFVIKGIQTSFRDNKRRKLAEEAAKGRYRRGP